MTARPTDSTRAAPVAVLMYHAVTDGRSSAAGADPHYTVTRTCFLAQLDLIRARDLRAASCASILAGGDSARSTVALTFDDGHESNFAAAEAIVERAMGADLFVNPGLVGKAGLLSWSALRELAGAGISIQSHGMTHRYLDDLDDTEVDNELRSSRAEIADRIGIAPTLFAPPGGRFRHGFLLHARDAGYRAVCSSRPGVWRADRDAPEIPRFAMLATTGEAQFRRWLACEPREVRKQRIRYDLLRLAKRSLGNRGYERLRGALLGAGGIES